MTQIYDLTLSAGQKSRYREHEWIQLRVSLSSYQGVNRAALPRSPVIGRTRFLVVVGLKSQFLAGCQPGDTLSSLRLPTFLAVRIPPSLSHNNA